ncbi:hypothetical protein GCM10029978_110330 [Actinoallomurus acanthiterrae]
MTAEREAVRCHIGALLHLDAELGTAQAQRFIGTRELWRRFAFAEQDPLAAQRVIQLSCLFAERLIAASAS